MRFTVLGALASLVLSCAPAQAAWHEASSDHFVIYADDTERDITTFARQLEQYHAGLALVTNTTLPVPSPSNRVTVYVVRNEREVRTLYGNAKSSVAGFYVPRAGASMAIVPAVQAVNGRLTWSMLVLLHEYAHHFMISSEGGALPRWMNEGRAEFFASAQFDRDGSMWLGRPANHRAAGLFYFNGVKVSEVLDPAGTGRRTAMVEDAFYGKSWLLYHYLTFEPSRKGQFTHYAELLAAGKSPRDAATGAFGDLDVLEKELDRYQSRGRMSALKLAPAQLKTGAVHVRALSPGEAAIMPVHIRSQKGVAPEEAKQLLAQAREIAGRYPADAAVQTALAECEHDAGNDKEAIIAADAAIKLDPRQTNAYVQKGLSLFRQAADAKDAAAAYSAARRPFVALNKIENDHPLPLIYYHRSYAEQGEKPSTLAVNGLIRAVELAPFDLGLRMNLGMVLLHEGRGQDAAIILKPVAYNPHGGPMAEAARKVIERVAKEPKWKGEGMEAPSEDPPGKGDS
ncbi:Flp pilus assembly protein TadD [Novosphingobium chloroacetimidivorans]|uniref:Flp pilus assembly protein TadD n=1 Tax=Novosphingobium chloroacetimidivorans TaxID=1428314 RepID=A0A7W7K7I5_9SPHN|nr:hypothetical protein [Novosphingobium chloroacetimidivorans]MBB4857038.1 Flp pilus assembly protein TadD [Novosphingobium chloroacetimidivorans]